jgi:hypothetical protein
MVGMLPLRAIVSLFKGEVSSRTLEGYRKRGERIYDLLNKQPQHGPWEQCPGGEMERLCAWNAFALQCFADALLEADTQLDPYTAGYTPTHMHGLLRRYYQTSIQWYEATLQASQDPHFAPHDKLPASLPAWKGASQYSPTTLSALRNATMALRDQALQRVETFVEVPKQRKSAGVQVYTFPQNHTQMVKLLLRKQEQAKRKLIGVNSQLAQGEVGSNTWLELRLAAGDYFALGQLTAMPELIKTG